MNYNFLFCFFDLNPQKYFENNEYKTKNKLFGGGNGGRVGLKSEDDADKVLLWGLRKKNSINPKKRERKTIFLFEGGAEWL